MHVKFHGFKYTVAQTGPSYESPGGWRLLWPLVEVVLQSTKTGRWTKLLCKLDSGATCCVFPLHCAEKLGLKLEDMPQGVSLSFSGQDRSYSADCRITLPEVPEITFTTRSLFIKSGDTHSDREFGLLGQLGLFENHQVLFDVRTERFYIGVEDKRGS